MSATYFESVKRQVREQDRREKNARMVAAVAPPEVRKLAPGLGLGLGVIVSLGMWAVIAKVVLAFIA